MFQSPGNAQRFTATAFVQKTRLALPHALIHLSLSLFTATFCSAGTISLTGILATPESTEAYSFSLSASGSVTLQTYGFGGGLNAAGNHIAAGGFDPFVGLFLGTGTSALFVDGTADDVGNYLSEPAACPPANTVEIGSVPGQCGDVRLKFTGLVAGTYTVILSDADYLPNALYEAPGGTLGDGFSDLTGGSLPFHTCYDLNNCNADTAKWALDVTTPTVVSVTPEPSSFGFAAIGMSFTVVFLLRRSHSGARTTTFQ